MTEAINTTAMSKEEFEQHHARTWNYVARVGKIWEGIAEEQQAIINGKGYTHLNYTSWQAYWDGEFLDETGWKSRAVEGWMYARRVKLQTPSTPGRAFEPSGAKHWEQLGSIKDPDQRLEFLENYAEYKPSEVGISHPFREAIKEFKGERVRDVLKPEDMEDIPSGEFDRFENWASETSKLMGPIRRMSPSEVADACDRLYPEKLDRHIDWADQVAHWYAAYRDELVSRQRAGIRAVK